MPTHKKSLYRNDMRRMLASISRTWSKLSYPRYVVQAYTIINPDGVIDIPNNFSRNESVSGWLSAKPIDRGVRLNEDAKLLEDVLGRIDKRAVEYCDRRRRAWNDLIERATAQIYRIYMPFDVPRYGKPRTYRSGNRRHPDDDTVRVYYDFLRIVRGKGDVEQIQKHNNAGIGGLQSANDRLNASINRRAVDRSVQDILAENHHIQYGP